MHNVNAVRPALPPLTSSSSECLRYTFAIVQAFRKTHELAVQSYEHRSAALDEGQLWSWKDNTEAALRKAERDFIALVAKELGL